MSLEGDLDVTVTDDGVEFAFTVANAGDAPIELRFRSGQLADFVVHSNGEEAWRWSEGRLFTQALQSRALAPGESLVRTATWPDPGPGRYTALARLEATNADVEARAEFAV